VNKQPKQAEAAEFPQDTTVEMGADYDGNPSLGVVGGSAEFHYFLASKTEDGSPQTVSRCRATGYEVCTVERMVDGDPQDRVLMRIPSKLFNARRNAKRKRRIESRQATRNPQGVPSGNVMVIDEAGDRPGSDDWEGED